MNAVSKRRWYHLSLRKVMLGMTISLIVVGFRIDYLRRCAAYHEHEAERFQLRGANTAAEAWDNLCKSEVHEELAYNYSAAIWAPWTIVEVPPLPEAP
jgi:hypothetical protein